MKKIINNADLHFEHETWQKELLFWKDEIKSFQKRLSEIASRWTDEQVLARLEQFQNQFFIHREKINDLLDETEGHEHIIAMNVNADHDAIDMKGYRHHEEIREQMESERLIYNDLKKRFFGFLSRYM
ncbi:hypothetical protein [Robertkochia flava]|uniref:hypothetical protein n=1 Tax=Robertkochia flava TaxID=3447986 RepID=UPI001CCEFB83|nr:hypothetical protein [Robertkochia marina]